MTRFCRWILVLFVLIFGIYFIRLGYVYLVRPVCEDDLISLNKSALIPEEALQRILKGIPADSADSAEIYYYEAFTKNSNDIIVVEGLFIDEWGEGWELAFVLCKEHESNWAESRVFRFIHDLPPMISESGITNPRSYIRLHELSDDDFWEILYEVTDESGGIEWISPIIKDGESYGPAPFIRERGWWRNGDCDTVSEEGP